jgi:oligopeptide/dipeptide ABC transporter ATP-binding protein
LLAIGMIAPDQGDVRFDGRPLGSLLKEDFKRTRRRLQIVMQNPYASLNPWMTVGAAITEALTFHGLVSGAKAAQSRIAELLEMVGLNPAYASRYPREFSGGQRQRLAIARALALEPEVLVCDEVTSAFDVSVRAQIINLLRDLAQRQSLAYLFITHDLHIARTISDRLAVMFSGRVVEEGPAGEVLTDPKHPYTQQLLAALPKLTRPPVPEGTVERGVSPVGCPFALRCPMVMDRCRLVDPPVVVTGPGRTARCLLYGA